MTASKPMRLSWPTAFALVFAAAPLAVFLIGALCTYPAVLLPALAIAATASCYHRRLAHHTALAERCATAYATGGATIAGWTPNPLAAPLPRANLATAEPAQRPVPAPRRPSEDPTHHRYARAIASRCASAPTTPLRRPRAEDF